MNLKKTLFFVMAAIIISISMAYSTVSEPNIFRYSEILGEGQYNDTDTPITNANVIGFVCSSANCSTVSDALDLSNGQPFADESNPPVLNSGGSDSVTVVYPTTLLSPFGYGLYYYKDGYIPYEGAVDWAGNGQVPAFTNYLSKKKLCFAQIENFTVLNDVQAHLPLIVDVNATLDADTRSALKFSPDRLLGYIPPMLADYYAVNTSVTLDIKNSLGTTVKSETKYIMINYSGSAHVSFEWTPTANGTYNASVTTGIPDAKCLSYETRSASAGFTVWPISPRDECYTLLGGLAISPSTDASVGQQINFTYNKTSNYANDTFPSDPHYLKPVATSASYTIYNSTNDAIFSSADTLPANPDSVNPAVQKYFWIPASIGQYWIKIAAIANDPLCIGKNNPPASISSSLFSVTDTAPPKILSIYPANGSEVHSNTFIMNATTDERAACKYGTSDADYASMPNAFATTGTTVHRQELALADGPYTYYMRCIDPSGNANTASNSTSFAVFTAARIEITASNVKVNQTDIFSLPITLNNTGVENAIGNLTIDIPDGLVNSTGSKFIEFNVAAGSPLAYTPAIEAVMWGDYYINLTARYNSSTIVKQVLVQSTPIPIYEFRFASPDSIVVGDNTSVVVGLYNRGIVNGYDLPVDISTSGELSVVGPSQIVVPQVRGNDTDFVNATYVTFNIKGISAGTGTINITIDGKTQTKAIIVRSSPLRIDLSVDALAPYNMSLGRLFKVTGVIYNMGSDPISAVTSIELDTGLQNMSQILFDLGVVPKTVNGTSPVMREWIVNGTESGFKQLNISVEYSSFNGTDFITGEIKDAIYVNILPFSEPVQPFIDIASAYPASILFGESFTINATLKNIGNDIAYNTLVSIENIGALTMLSANLRNLGDFARDEEQNVSWSINATQAGAFNAVVLATPIGHRFEDTLAFSVLYPHDVSILQMSAPASATEGNTVAISAILKNIGASNETEVPVIFSVDGAPAQTRYYNVSIGENKTAGFSWVASVGTHTLSLYANLTNDGDISNNGASAIISVSPIGGSSGGGGGGSGSSGSGGSQFAAQAIKNNKDAYFSNIIIPSSINYGEQLRVSGCVNKLDKNSTVLLYLDGALKNSAKATIPSTCFNISAGIPNSGNRTVYIWLNGSNVDFTKTVAVIKGTGTEEAATGADLLSAEILTEEYIIKMVPTTVLVSINAKNPSELSVFLFSDGTLMGQKEAFIAGESNISFNYTFNETGERTLRAFVRTAGGGEERLAVKKITVLESMPTGSFLSGILKNPVTALAIISLGAAVYFGIIKKRAADAAQIS